MKCRKVFIFLLSFGAVNFRCLEANRLFAAEPDVLSIDKAIEFALNTSPEVKALRAQYSSAKAKAYQALSPNDPQLQWNWNDARSSFHISDAASTNLTLTQSFAFPGKSWVNFLSLSEQAESLAAQMKAQELKVRVNVKSAFMALMQARENLKLNLEQQKSLERILEIAKRRYENATTTQVDLLNAQVTLYSTVNDANDLKAAETTALAQLNVLLGRPPSQPWEIGGFKRSPAELPTVSDAERKMLENQFELKAARRQVSASGYAYRLAQMSLLPDFALSAGITKYNVTGASPWSTIDDKANTTYGVGLQMTIPLWFLFNERQAMVAAHHDRAAAEANLEVSLNQARASLFSTLETLKALSSKLTTYENHLLPLSEQALKIALISYSTGKIDFQTLVDTANVRRNTRRDFAAAMGNYVTQLSTLGQLMGENL